VTAIPAEPGLAGARSIQIAAQPLKGDAIVTSPMNPPSLDLDQVAALLAGLRPALTAQGLIVRSLSWRDARDPWPQPLHYDRSTVTEPESVGLRLSGPDGREARLVIWRGGWADVDVLAGGAAFTRCPDLDDLASCAALARSLAGELTAPPRKWGTDLRPVTIAWTTDWWDGPVEGMATYQGRDCWFRAIFDTEADEWTSPRRCRLYELSPGERDRLWARHSRWEQHGGGNNCHHPGAPGPGLKPGADTYRDPDHQPAQAGALIGEFTAPLLSPRGMAMPAREEGHHD
jgi:hypothetical protein